MADSKQNKAHRYLIGRGEKITSEERFISGFGEGKESAYSVEEAVNRLRPQVLETVRKIEAVPSEACPVGEAVSLITLHPEFLAKTYFPLRLFSSVGLRAIGSRARMVEPEKWTPTHQAGGPSSQESIELYMAGTVSDYRAWAQSMGDDPDSLTGISELVRIEAVRSLEELNPAGRIQLPEKADEKIVLEVALHVPEEGGRAVIRSFNDYAASLEAQVHQQLSIEVSGLVFYPVVVPKHCIEALAQFTFLRSMRPVTKLRGLPTRKITRAIGAPFQLPAQKPLNPSIRVAVMDGGLPESHGVPYVQYFQTPQLGAAHPDFFEHGLAVTGAVMWGCLEEPGVPYGTVDHFRVLDVNDSRRDDLHAYRVLKRIQDVIETGSHDLFNLSLGPDVSVDDDEVHAWTSTLDALAADGSRMIVTAAGNNGDFPSPLCRIQVPGDGVNCLSVGAASSRGALWERAPYSAKGPGRRPGLKKPDVMAFGGSLHTPFRVLRLRGGIHTVDNDMGTSFAAPLVTRAAAGLRSLFTANLSPLTIKCLLIHSADPVNHPSDEVGWGRISSEADLPLCPPNTARIVYQGELPPKKLLRARIPVPRGLTGRVAITATICYATKVRASDPLNYTNSGVEPVFRPNASVFAVNKETNEPANNPKSASFFTSGAYASEEERRTRHQKWETVLHATKRFNASSLVDPVLDLHFIPRLGALDDGSAERIRYAMVISVITSNHDDIYERVLAEYGELQAMTPVEVQLQV